MIAIDAWQPADGLTLEPNALLAAKEQVRCLALTAGPGAGKTEMLAQRADFLLRTGICRYPKRILAISFKVDASKNLKERVQRRCGAELASRFDSYTFHAFAKRIIDRFRPVLTGNDSLEPGYTIGKTKVAHKQIVFDDLVPLAIQILKKSKLARNAIRQTYCDVFLDEFQDCTDKQYELVKLTFQGTGTRRDFDRLIKAQRKSASLLELIDEPYSGWWESARGFLNKIPRETLVALSPDYESQDRLKEVVRDTKARIEELLKIEPELPKALERFMDDKAVRILTIHKSKGLEFNSVIILGVENQTFWGKPDEERCGFFVGVSRAKRRLVVTMSKHRETPPSNPYRWQEKRTPHTEFFGYAMPFVSTENEE